MAPRVNRGKGGRRLRRKFCGPGTLLLLALAYALDTEGVFPYFAAAAILHELGHALAVFACGGHVRDLAPAPFGFSLRYDGLLSYGKDAVIALSGPAANLAAAGVGIVVGRWLPETRGTALFTGVNLMIGLFNLLPARPLDGGQILYALAARQLDVRRAETLTRAVTRLLGLGITALGVYILLKTRYNISILAVGSLILGGTYAEGAGEDTAPRAQARPLFRRRVRAGGER